MSRPVCPHCERPLQRCFCSHVVPTNNHCRLLLLQHPNEAGHPKNTGELLWHSLTNCERLIGETFTDEQLAPFMAGAALLYPEADDQPPMAEGLIQASPSTLIVLDATWRKSRKMLYQNPQIQALPRFTLEHLPESRYRIRSAEQQHQLSTLEASCYALQQIEGNTGIYLPLLTGFDQYMTHLASFDPNRH